MELICMSKENLKESKFIPVKTDIYSIINKPLGGLWTSTINEESGLSYWEEWCENNQPDFLTDRKKYVIVPSDDIKILTINSKKDYNTLPRLHYSGYISFIKSVIDYDKIAEEYDAINLTMNGLISNNTVDRLHYWDVPTFLLLKWKIKKFHEVEQ